MPVTIIRDVNNNFTPTYKQELDTCFFSYNKGLESRFTWSYETEKYSNKDLDIAKNKLKLEIDKVKELINAQKNDEAITILDSCKIIIEEYANS